MENTEYTKHVDTYIYLYNHYKKWMKTHRSLFAFTNKYAIIHTDITITRRHKLDIIAKTDKYIKFSHNNNIYVVISTGIPKIDNSYIHKYSRNYRNISIVTSWDNPNSEYVLFVTYLRNIFNNNKIRYVAATDLEYTVMYESSNSNKCSIL